MMSRGRMFRHSVETPNKALQRHAYRYAARSGVELSREAVWKRATEGT